MKLLRSLFVLLFMATLSFSCTEQDLNEDEKLTNDTEVYADGGNGNLKTPPPPGTGG